MVDNPDYPKFPTDYYTAGGHMDSARYLGKWYGVAFNPHPYHGLANARTEALAYVKELRELGYWAKCIEEDGRNKLNPDMVQYRVWYDLFGG